LNSLTSFKKRHDDAKRRLTVLESQSTDVDFGYYRSVLKNQSIIDEIEKSVRGYTVKKVDVSRQIKAIEGFETTAIKSAEETKGQVEKELKDLEATLQNIQGARAFEDLTVVCYEFWNGCSEHSPCRESMGRGMLINNYRTKLWPRSPRLRSVLRQWSLTTGGCRPDTRYVLFRPSYIAIWSMLITTAGEVR